MGLGCTQWEIASTTIGLMAWPFSTVSPSEMVRAWHKFAVVMVMDTRLNPWPEAIGVCSLSILEGQLSETDPTGEMPKVLVGVAFLLEALGRTQCLAFLRFQKVTVSLACGHLPVSNQDLQSYKDSIMPL